MASYLSSSDNDTSSDSEIETEKLDMVDKYVLIEKCAGGAFSSVYRGENVRTGAPVAIKTEPMDSEVGLLQHEVKMYMKLRGVTNIFLPKWYGMSNQGLRCLVLPIGPPSLADSADVISQMHIGARIIISERILSLLVDTLSSIHERGIIHRDIKPANVLFDFDAEDETSQKLTIIDLGMATYWPQTRCPMALVGSPAFASFSAHVCEPPAPAQDIESASYTALFVREGGSVPWRTTYEIERIESIMEHIGDIGVVWRASRTIDEDDKNDDVNAN